jgi:hypothetical protein
MAINGCPLRIPECIQQLVQRGTRLISPTAAAETTNIVLRELHEEILPAREINPAVHIENIGDIRDIGYSRTERIQDCMASILDGLEYPANSLESGYTTNFNILLNIGIDRLNQFYVSDTEDPIIISVFRITSLFLALLNLSFVIKQSHAIWNDLEDDPDQSRRGMCETRAEKFVLGFNTLSMQQNFCIAADIGLSP